MSVRSQGWSKHLGSGAYNPFCSRLIISFSIGSGSIGSWPTVALAGENLEVGNKTPCIGNMVSVLMIQKPFTLTVFPGLGFVLSANVRNNLQGYGRVKHQMERRCSSKQSVFLSDVFRIRGKIVQPEER